MGVQKYLPQLLKNGFKMAIYLSFLVPKITAIVHATPTNARPTPTAWNHEHDRVSDFTPHSLSFGVAMVLNSNEK